MELCVPLILSGAEGNLVSSIIQICGTHTGTFMGFQSLRLGSKVSSKEVH